MKTIFLYLLPLLATAHPERWYQERAAEKLGGKMEVRVSDGRVDIVTETHAIEVEKAAKWKHAIGQALWRESALGKEKWAVVGGGGRW